MAFRCIVLAALVAVAQAGVIGAPAVLAPGLPLGARLASPLGAPISPLGYAAPLGLAPRLAAPIAKTIIPSAIDTDYDPNPSYSYAYDIQDALTGDSKNQQESRQGDVVQGSYSLVEPDGTRRTVEYTADPVNGFNAVVHREPLGVAKAVVAAPAIAHASPLAYASPIARVGLANPLAASLAHPALAARVGLAGPLGAPILG